VYERIYQHDRTLGKDLYAHCDDGEMGQAAPAGHGAKAQAPLALRHAVHQRADNRADPDRHVTDRDHVRDNQMKTDEH
jgi:hypothetical protein